MLPFVALQVPNANTQASLYHKIEDLVDKTASQSVFFPIFAHVDMKTIKHDSNKQDKNSNGQDCQSLHCNIPPDQTVTNI
jgi:hypothetical protein